MLSFLRKGRQGSASGEVPGRAHPAAGPQKTLLRSGGLGLAEFSPNPFHSEARSPTALRTPVPAGTRTPTAWPRHQLLTTSTPEGGLCWPNSPCPGPAMWAMTLCCPQAEPHLLQGDVLPRPKWMKRPNQAKIYLFIHFKGQTTALLFLEALQIVYYEYYVIRGKNINMWCVIFD